MMIVNLISPDGRYDSIFLSNYATIQIKDELGRLPGVADITYLGQRDYSLRAWLDPDKLAALNLSADDVVTAISAAELAGRRRPDRPAARPQGPAIPADHQHAGPADRPGAVRRHHPQGRPGRLRRRSRLTGGSTGQRGSTATVRRALSEHEHAAAARAAGHRHRPAARRGPRRAGLAAVRPVLHARRPAVGGAVDLPAARLQRPGDRRAASTPR